MKMQRRERAGLYNGRQSKGHALVGPRNMCQEGKCVLSWIARMCTTVTRLGPVWFLQAFLCPTPTPVLGVQRHKGACTARKPSFGVAVT